MRKLIGTFALVLMALGLLVAPASAYTFDSATGQGFVGKGEVQLALGYSNKQLQANADSLTFSYESTTVTEVSWTCTNTKNENIQERERTTTTESSGVVEAVERDNKKQITGFILTGYDGSQYESSTSEGNQLNSCPTNWELTSAGDPVVISSTSSLTVNDMPLN